MPHLDPDRLILIALGEQSTSPDESAHLAGCDDCRDELATTETVAELGRDSHDVRELPAPPVQLWDRIAAEAFAAPPSPALPDLAPPLPAAPAPQPPAGSAPRPPAAPASRPAASPRRPVSPVPFWTRRRLGLAVAAAALLGAATVVGVQQFSRSPEPRVVARADLLPQAAAPGTAYGTATIIDTGHGLEMNLDMSGMPDPSGYYTVWLYDGGTVMIPIGSPGSAPLNVPAAAADLTRFQVVDISAQQLGQQEHGTSMLQGRLSR